jgi:hypothetical protein
VSSIDICRGRMGRRADEFWVRGCPRTPTPSQPETCSANSRYVRYPAHLLVARCETDVVCSAETCLRVGTCIRSHHCRRGSCPGAGAVAASAREVVAPPHEMRQRRGISVFVFGVRESRAVVVSVIADYDGVR